METPGARAKSTVCQSDVGRRTTIVDVLLVRACRPSSVPTPSKLGDTVTFMCPTNSRALVMHNTSDCPRVGR